MKKKLNPYRADLCLPRMSWSAENLYNIHLRTSGPLRKDLTFTKSSKTLFQQQWFAKKLVRGYHGDWIQEGKFQKAFLPLNIPPIIGSQSPSTSQLQKGKSAQPVAQREEGRGGQKVPLGSLMFREVERRLDVLVFRACFAPSAYAAKMMVVTGQVSLNGIKETNPNVKLKPGDIFSVDPNAIPMLDPQAKSKHQKLFTAEEPVSEAKETEETASAESSEASEPTEPQAKAKEEPTIPIPQSSSLPSGVKPFNLPDFAAPFIFIPPYLEISFPTCSAVYVRHPTARIGYSEIPTPYAADGEIVRLAWEWYQKSGRGRRRLPHKRLPPNSYIQRGMDTSHIVNL